MLFTLSFNLVDIVHKVLRQFCSERSQSLFNQPYAKMLFEVVRIPFPTTENANHVAKVLQNLVLDESIAGFIYEPLVQGVSGFRIYSREILDNLLSICHQANILTIADEVMTGFGRTGYLFASDSCDEKPDFICLAKALTGGVLPLAVTISNPKIYKSFQANIANSIFYHGHSYTANPVACAAAIASLKILTSKESAKHRDNLQKAMAKQVERFSTHQKLKNVRAIGNIFAADIINSETTSYSNSISVRIKKFFLKKGIIIRPLGNVFYFMPPYCVQKSEINHVFDVLEEFLNDQF